MLARKLTLMTSLYLIVLMPQQGLANGVSSRVNYGVARTENISAGYVPAPGIEDFAAYYRNNSLLSASSNESAVFGNATKVPASHPASTNSEWSGILGSASTAQLKKQSEAETLREETIASIEKLLAASPNSNQTAELQLRLANLQIERYGYFLETEIQAFNQAYDNWLAKGKVGAEPKIDNSKSRQQLLQGTKALRNFVTNWPTHSKSPEALFTLGMLLAQLDSENALLYYEKLLKSYPKSDYVPDTLLAIGEWHFAKKNWKKAAEFYQKILGFKETRAYPYGVYKLGWAYFNQRDKNKELDNHNLARSIAAFKLLIKLADAPGSNPLLKNLRTEALKDSVLVFAEIGNIEAAQQYYLSLNQNELYFTLLERLAWLHADKGNYTEALKVYNKLLEEAPTSAKVPSYYGSIAKIADKAGKTDELVTTMRMAAKFLAAGGVWSNANISNPEAQRFRTELLDNQLFLFAQKIHAAAQKQKGGAGLNEALACYQIYLQANPQGKNSYEVHFFAAEIFGQQSRFLEAANEYMMAVSIDKERSYKGKFTQKALENAIVSLETILSKNTVPVGTKIGKEQNPMPLPKVQTQLLLALDQFVELYPNHKDNPAYAHKAASLLYYLGDYSAAEKRWFAQLKKNFQVKEIQDGVRLSLKVSVDRANWAKVIQDARSLLDLPNLKSAKFGQELEQVLKEASFQHALHLDKSGEAEKAISVFVAYQQEFFADRNAATALYNAANIALKQGRVEESNRLLQRLLDKYPNSDLRPHAHYFIARGLDTLGQFAQSAEHFERLANNYANMPFAPDSLMRAIMQRNASANPLQALNNANVFIAKYPSHADKYKAYIEGSEALNTLGEQSKSIKYLLTGSASLQKSQPTKAALLVGLAAHAATRTKDFEQASTLISAGMGILSKLTEKQQQETEKAEAARLLGESQLAVLDDKVKLLYSNRVSDPKKITEEFLKIREQAFVLAKNYTSVVKLGNAESAIAAMYRIAEINEFLANVLLKSPVPVTENMSQVEEFKASIEKVALPLQEDAVAMYQKALDTVHETEALSVFTKKIQDKLANLRPGEFKKMITDFPEPSYYESNILLTKETNFLIKK